MPRAAQGRAVILILELGDYREGGSFYELLYNDEYYLNAECSILERSHLYKDADIRKIKLS